MADPYANVLPMGTFAGLAFWLIPSPSPRAVLKREMEALRSSNPEAPEFESHATLLAGIQPGQDGQKERDTESIINTAKGAVEAWRNDGNEASLTCQLQDVTTGGFYFQCILIALHKQSSLLSLNAHIRTAFDLASQAPFFPHISLLYSSINADEAKRQIKVMEDKGTFTRTHAADRDGIAFAGLSEIEFVSIDLYDCNGPPNQWKRLGRIPLSP